MAVAGWSLLATTLLVWFLAQGGVVAVLGLVRAPGVLLTSRAVGAWELGAVGAFVLFLAAFVLCQAVGRGLLRLLAPTPLAWPEAVPRPSVPVRLLAFRSARPDAFTFTLLRPSRQLSWLREEVILVSERLLGALEPAEWQAVVAHELGHIREYDGRYLTFLRTFARLMRWDPILATVASRLTRREEFCADEAAVAMTGRPRALARAIYKAAHLAPASRGVLAGLLGPGGAAGHRQAIERIRRLVVLAESGRFEEEGRA
jgi:Zn-dependent protease with chaperone function